MAQTKKKRRRKHRGTQAGTVDRAGSHAARPGARATPAQRREARLDREPTVRGAVNRAAGAAVIFGLVAALALGQDPAAAAGLAVFAFVFYIPVGYYLDRFIWNRRRRSGGAGAGSPRPGKRRRP